MHDVKGELRIARVSLRLIIASLLHKRKGRQARENLTAEGSSELRCFKLITDLTNDHQGNLYPA